MIIALSGSQGSGKTTILNGLSTLGYNVIERKTSRSVLKEWDMTLEEVYSNHKLMTKFQNAIFDMKYSDERKIYSSREIWFTDRSFVDILAYPIMVVGSDPTCSNWLGEYYDKCMVAELNYFKRIYVPRLNLDIEHDGVRSTCNVYSKSVDDVMRGLHQTIPDAALELETMMLDERINEIVDVVKYW